MIRVSGFFSCGVLAAVSLAGQALEKPTFFIDPNKPGVYLGFVRIGPREPLSAGESNAGVYLELHNNTLWSIVLQENGVPETHGDAGVFYDIIEDPEGYPPTPIPRGYFCHVCSSNDLPSGKKLVFSIPKEHLGEGLGIQMDFHYGWENERGRFLGAEPRHSVVFYHSNLPERFRVGERRRPAPGEIRGIKGSIEEIKMPIPSTLEPRKK